MDWCSDHFGVVMLILIAIVLPLIVVSELQWQQFVVDHACKKIAETAGSTVTGIAGNGVLQAYIPSKTEWLCDDGV